ncbi:MAG: hypothetical protein LWW93_11990 [Hyphomicrobiales bacterium]|nr:hypothetical protein [Hyphomicrobiales bacterium]
MTDEKLPTNDPGLDLLPFTTEACAALGYVKVDAAEWLAGEITAAMNRNNGRSIREGGKRLTKEERQALGIPVGGGHLNYVVWQSLTEKGRRDPIASFDVTCSRALANARRAASLMRLRKVLDTSTGRAVFAGVRVSALSIGCQASKAIAGVLFDTPPALPLSECDRETCSCDLIAVSRYEVAKRKG